MPLITTLGKQRFIGSCEFQAILVYAVILSQKQNSRKKTKITKTKQETKPNQQTKKPNQKRNQDNIKTNHELELVI